MRTTPSRVVRTLLALLLLAALYGGKHLYDRMQGGTVSGRPAAQRSSSSATAVGADGAAIIADAFARERSGFMVEVDGVVEKTLPDDREGSAHQRFIIRMSDGHTVLITHNLDLAPRVPLREGDAVQVLGQYEWNDRGGVLHWTHHDPEGRHAEGWIDHRGQRYE